MALFDQFPYTNMHEINLDWIIGQIKTYTEKVDAMQISIDQLDQMIDDLKAFVIEQIEDLDIAQAVSDKLDEMLADGTLADIIASVYPQRTAYIERYGRILDRFTKEGVDRRLYMQSCCYANNNYYFCGNTADDDSAQSVSKWSKSGAFVAGEDYTDLGHANDICYHDGKLYVATGFRLVVIDAETLAITGTVERSGTLVTVFGVAADNDNGYIYMIGTVAGGIIGIDRYDVERGTVTNIANSIPSYAETKQGACYLDGYIYVVYGNTNSIARISVDTGELDCRWILPTNDGYFWTGEPEAPFVYNGAVCFMAVMPLQTAGYVTSVYAQLFKTDITGIVSMTGGKASPAMQPIGVSVNGNASDEFNPTSAFTAVEELNALVPDLQVRMRYVADGYVGRPHGSSLSITRSAGTVSLSALSCKQGTVLLNGVAVGLIAAETSNLILKLSPINSGTMRFCEIISEESTISGVTNLERSSLNIVNNATIGLDASPTNLNYCSIVADIKRVDDMAALFTAIQSFIDSAGTRVFAAAFDILTTGGEVIHAGLSFTKAGMANPLTVTSGAYSITWSSSGLTVTSGGSAVSVKNVISFHLIG